MMDPDGWGSSWYVNPFVSGADAQDGRVVSIEAVPGDMGIAVSLGGSVPRDGVQSFGSWAFVAIFKYDPSMHRADAKGHLAVKLPGPLTILGADLNLYRIASNFLRDVPLQSGGRGDSGDMKNAVVSYSDGVDSRNFVWLPSKLPVHFPTDASNFLRIDVVGNTNSVDTAAQGNEPIAVARKPSLSEYGHQS
jgi:hypothetical protein